MITTWKTPGEKLRCRVLHGARKDSNKGWAPGDNVDFWILNYL